MAITDHHLRVLEILLTDLAGVEYPWCITGSLGLALQGVDVFVNDIDLQSTRQGVLEMEERLGGYVTEPVMFKESENIRSFFGRCEIEDIVVELMGDVQKIQNDGHWADPPDLREFIHLIKHNNLILPVLDLEYEAEAYEALGRLDKSSKIRETIEGNMY
ncbi:MAG: hypothetical protein GTO18_12710 [Anaerolineales bacterium]|nr:hypothetical protein [Anaerolineales bacterium]